MGPKSFLACSDGFWRDTSHLWALFTTVHARVCTCSACPGGFRSRLTDLLFNLRLLRGMFHGFDSGGHVLMFFCAFSTITMLFPMFRISLCLHPDPKDAQHVYTVRRHVWWL